MPAAAALKEMDPTEREAVLKDRLEALKALRRVPATPQAEAS